MLSCSVSDFTKSVTPTLSNKATTIIIKKNKPSNVVFNVEGMEFDEVVDFARQLEGFRAFKGLQSFASKSDARFLSDAEIEAEIDAVRGKN